MALGINVRWTNINAKIVQDKIKYLYNHAIETDNRIFLFIFIFSFFFLFCLKDNNKLSFQHERRICIFFIQPLYKDIKGKGAGKERYSSGVSSAQWI